MNKVVVADASCLIALSKIDQLQVLKKLFGRIFIPLSVFHEVVTKGAGRPGAKEVSNAEWIETCEVKDQLAVNALKLTLGAGEAEAIVLASESKATYIILDDWQARQMALGLSLSVIGTVAVLAKAVEKGILSDLESILEQLRQVGFHFSI
jgi:predicted nucleic acid-binding protein